MSAGRCWTVRKSTAGEWLSFDLNATSARLAQLTYHRTHAAAIAATCRKIKRGEVWEREPDAAAYPVTVLHEPPEEPDADSR